ncbi:hypothetical protein D3C75_1279830 [compost metagenome]
METSITPPIELLRERIVMVIGEAWAIIGTGTLAMAKAVTGVMMNPMPTIRSA